MRTVAAALLLLPIAILALVGSLLLGATAVLTPTGTLAVLHRADAGKLANAVLVEQVRRADVSTVTSDVPVLTAEDLAALAGRVLPSSQFDAWFTAAAPPLYAWLDRRTETLAVPLDLRATKVRVASEVGSLLQQRAPQLPECGAADAAAAQRGEVPVCRLPGETVEAFRTRVERSGAIDTFVRRIPDSVDLGNLGPAAASVTGTATSAVPTTAASLERARTLYGQRRSILAVPWLLVGLLGLLVLLLHRTPTPHLLRWVGAVLLSVGVPALLVGLVGVLGTIPSARLTLPSDTPIAVRDGALALLQATLVTLARAPLVLGGSAFLLAIIAFVASVVHPHPRTEHA